MKLVKQKLHKITEYYQKKPKMLVPTVAILCLFVFALFECVRAYRYEQKIDDFRESVKVQNIQQTVLELQKSTSDRHVSAYCDMTIDGLLADFNKAYEPTVEEARRPENLHIKLQGQITEISPPPRFSSLADFLPRPKNASSRSAELQGTVQSLDRLSKLDLRSDYCLQLSEVLSRTYFLSDLKKPEGVGALYVGQRENFQTNVAQAQEMMKTLKYPTDLEAEHIQLFALLNQVAIDLRNDENKYVAFARNIEKNVDQLQAILDSIRVKTADMQEIPDKITLYAGQL